jgi:aerobic C4-dicarboxylate transport protein
MSEARALTNLVGNGVATLVVAKWCKQLDTEQLDAVLAGRAPALTEEEPSVADSLALRLTDHDVRPDQAPVRS